jgi:hypothetical protein
MHRLAATLRKFHPRNAKRPAGGRGAFDGSSGAGGPIAGSRPEPVRLPATPPRHRVPGSSVREQAWWPPVPVPAPRRRTCPTGRAGPRPLRVPPGQVPAQSAPAREPARSAPARVWARGRAVPSPVPAWAPWREALRAVPRPAAPGWPAARPGPRASAIRSRPGDSRRLRAVSRPAGSARRQRLRVVGERAHIGDDVGALRRVPDAGEAHGRARDVAARVGQEPVEILVGPLHPLLALLAHGGRVVEVAVDDVVADHVPEVRADLVGGALREVVARRALGDRGLALLDARHLQPVGDRHHLRRGRRLAFTLDGLGHGNHVARLAPECAAHRSCRLRCRQPSHRARCRALPRRSC